MTASPARPARLVTQPVTLCDVIDRVRDALSAHGIPTGEPDGVVVVTGHRIAVLAGDTRTDLSEDDWTLIRVWPHDDPEDVAAVVERAVQAERRRR